MRVITSKQNKNFKLYQSLKLKKYRDQHGLFLVYGKHLVEQAKLKDVIHEIITSTPDTEGTLYDKSLMDELQQAETYFDLIAVCKKEQHVISSDRILVLDDVQDPDNVGALIRSASAFGFLHIILSPHSADLYNEKTIRASKGAIFDVYVERKPLLSALTYYKEQGYQIIYADAHDRGHIDLINKTVLILGNEGHGISKEIKDMADGAVHIETKHVESLNVSVAGSILMYLWRSI
jgi:TrmH family RNA methyltransferase